MHIQYFDWKRNIPGRQRNKVEFIKSSVLKLILLLKICI